MKLNLRKVLAVVMTAVVALGVSAQNLYIFGSFNGWDPANSIEMWNDNGVYVMEEIEFGAGGNFAFATIQSSDWDAVNANRYGFEEDNAKAVEGLAMKIVKGTGAIQVPAAGIYNIYVNLSAMTVTIKKAGEVVINAPNQLYVMGNLSVGSWDPATAVELTKDGNKFYGKVTFTGSGDGYSYFVISGAKGDWTLVNANRFAPVAGEVAFNLDEKVEFGKGESAFKIAAEGTYYVTVDFDLMIVTVSLDIPEFPMSDNSQICPDGHIYAIDTETGITCKNKWIIDRVHTPEQFLNLQFIKDYSTKARTAVIDSKRSKIYLGYSKPIVIGEGDAATSTDYAHLVVMDLETGEYIKELPLTCNGEAISGLLCANQVGIDDFGHVWICGMYSDVNAKPAQIYVVEDFETGACKLVGEWKLPDEEADAAGRIDHWDVVGDITGKEANAVCMGAVGTTASGEKLCLYRWELAQGATEWVANEDDFAGYVSTTDITDTYPADQVTWGASSATVKIVAEEGYLGSMFYVDGFTTCPSLYRTSLSMVESFASATDLAPAVGPNGIEEFTLGGKRFIAYAEAQYIVSPGCRVNICQIGEDRSFEGMRKLWSVPEGGLGEVSDGGTRVHNIDTYKVIDENGKEGVYLLTYKCNNGLGLYLIAEDGFTGSFTQMPSNSIEINGVIYTIDADTKNANIIKTTETLPNTLVIPSQINYKEETYTVTEITKKAFNGCRKLTSVTIPNSITTIGDYAFSGCENLVNIYSLNTTPPSCSATAFSDYSATLYVPQNSYAKYFIDDVWGKFDNLKKIEALVSSITLDKTALEIIQGETYQLTATIEPENSIISTLMWESSNPEIAKVDNNGKVTGVSKGTAVISAKAIDGSNVSASCIVTVGTIMAQSIELSQTEVSMLAGNLLNLGYTVLPQNTTDKSITWISSDDKVATIVAYSNGTATIKGVSAGSATIFAVTNDGSNLTAMCKVTVKSGKAETITLSQTEAELPVNDIMTLSYTILPTDAVNKTATWATSDKSIAAFKVNNDGSITIVGVSEGIAIITATTNDGSNLSASCIIRVTNTSGIDSIVSNCSVTEVARYDIYGRLLSKPTLGINIVKYSDGTTRKECVK